MFLQCVEGTIVKMSSLNLCSQSYCFQGSKVVDGIYAPIGVHELTSIAITEQELSPWIQIDLQDNFCISAVKIWNRNKDILGTSIRK